MKVIPKYKKGFVLVELIVGVAVFTIICVSVYNAYVSIFNVVYASRAKLVSVDLANEELEIIRNLPYADVGIYGGIPSGKLSHNQTIVRSGTTFDVTVTVRNIDDPFDGVLGGTPNDSAPADYKVVEVEIACATCVNFTPIDVTTRVAPKNLETASTNGALFIKVFDANGNPVEDANVHVVNALASPTITIDDVTNINGMLQIVDAPPGINAYNISVTKPGYTSDQTLAPTGGNPNPKKPFSTVVLQGVTSISFTIDKISSFAVTSVNALCANQGNIDFNLAGNYLIGTSPDVQKYNQNLKTNVSGTVSIPNLQWDSYDFNLTDDDYELIGINPISPINLIPNSNQNVQIVVAPKKPKTLLIEVIDGASGFPLSDVDVGISASGFTTATSTTGQGFIKQTDWSGGSGQATSTDTSKYLSSDGNIEVNSPAGDIKLRNIFGDYVSSGVITSSSFDTGSASNFQKIQWTPVDQPIATDVPNVRVQIATNNDGATWNFSGPDGTSGTYYTLGNQNINSANNGKEFLRYKIFFDTATTTATPNISDLFFTFTSTCTPPGQVLFNDLNSGTYNLHFTKPGYVDQDISVPVNSAWQNQRVTMLPS